MYIIQIQYLNDMESILYKTLKVLSEHLHMNFVLSELNLFMILMKLNQILMKFDVWKDIVS